MRHLSVPSSSLSSRTLLLQKGLAKGSRVPTTSNSCPLLCLGGLASSWGERP